MLFSMTDKTYEFWRPTKPLKMEELRDVEIDVEKIPILRVAACLINAGARFASIHIFSIHTKNTNKCERIFLATCFCSLATTLIRLIRW